MVELVSRAVSWIRSGAAFLVVACFAYMTVAVLAQVSGRYFFNYSISWTEETARFAQVWVVLVGAGIAMRRGLHVAVEVLAAMLPLPLRRILSVVTVFSCLWFLAVVIYGSFALIELGWIFETSPVVQIPMWIIYLSLPIGAVYFGIEVIVAAIDRWRDPFAPPSAKDADSAA